MIEDYLTPLLYIVCLSLTWLTAGFLIIRRTFDPGFIFLLLSAYTLIVPGSFYFLDLDSLPSTRLINSFSTPLLLQCMIITVFIFGLIIGFLSFQRPVMVGNLFPHFSNKQLRPLILFGVILLSIASSIFAAYALILGGSVTEAVGLVRYEGIYDEFNFVRQFIRIGSFLCIAYLFDSYIRYKKGQYISKYSIPIAFLLLMINLFAAIITGGKTYLIYPLFTIILAYALYFKKRPVYFVIPFLVMMIFMVLGIQYMRVVYVAENNFDLEGQAIIGSGTGYLDTNLIYLDRMVERTSVGEDFYNGIAGVIPRFLWSDKPQNVSAGGKFRRTVVPTSKAGWPVLGCNLWYSNFGWLGVLIGGFLSGLLIKAFSFRYRDYKENPYSFCFFILFSLLILLPGGLDNQFFLHYIMNVLPIWMFLALSHRFLLPRHVLKYQN